MPFTDNTCVFLTFFSMQDKVLLCMNTKQDKKNRKQKRIKGNNSKTTLKDFYLEVLAAVDASPLSQVVRHSLSLLLLLQRLLVEERSDTGQSDVIRLKRTGLQERKHMAAFKYIQRA